MTTYRRRTRVDAPLDAVWDFHSRIEGLEALTPGWTNLRVESVRGPDGEDTPEILETGARITLSVQPLGVGPRQQVVSVISAREREDGNAYFRDVMDDGPLAEWEHTHSFFADEDETILEDRVVYEFPTAAGRALSPLAWVGFDPLFRYRHRRTKSLLEAGDTPAGSV